MGMMLSDRGEGIRKEASVSEHRWYHLVRLGFVGLSVTAIVTQFGVTLDRGSSVPNFFSFFTIQSNVIALVVLLLSALFGLRGEPTTPSWEMWRGGATAWMATTGIVFLVLLSGLDADLQLTEPWVDTVLHQVMPVVMVLDWLLAPTRFRLEFRRALVWATYPVLYCAYSLVRGAFVDWYPYPFLDPGQDGGYWAVAAYSVGIAVLFIGLIWLVVWGGNASRAWWASRQTMVPA